MKTSFPLLLKLIALLTAVIFVWDQVVFAEGVAPYDPYQTQSVQPSTDATGVGQGAGSSQLTTNTTTDFLLNAISPLSPAQNTPQQMDPNKTYDEAGNLRTELAPDGHTIRHIYEGESIQEAVNQAASGDTVYLHAGTYHEHLSLRQGVNLSGEDAQTTVINGDYQAQSNIISALGDNRIENLTITGGGPYAGYPASAIRVEGDNVKIRNDRFVDNQDYGIYVWSGANTLVEMNLFKDTYLGVQLPKDTTVIRYNTFIHNNIAMNILNGTTPLVENNVFTGNTFQSIYEFFWGRTPSMGYAMVRNNTFFNNVEHGSYYGSATPPAVTERRDGNLLEDPQFTNAATGDYSIQVASPSYGRGAFLPSALGLALDRASHLNTASTIQAIVQNGSTVGYQIIYGQGVHDEFYNDGQVIHHVYADESIQSVIDGANASDTVYLHVGTYHEHLTLKQGVNLKGEDVTRTIVNGDYASGAAVIRALGENRIENVTVTGARAPQGQALGAISIEGDKVKVRNNLIVGNLSAGIYVAVNVPDILIETNTFVGNTTAIKEPKDGNVIRYNTITGSDTVSVPRISGISYVPNRGFQLEIAQADGIYSYRMEYSDDGGSAWKHAQTEISPGIFEDQLILANNSRVTTWLDDGSSTNPGPFDVMSRWYRAVVAESFTSNIGIEVLGGKAPVVQNNIITNQKVQSILESSTGFARVESNVLFNNQELGDTTGQHLPPAINPKTGENWTGGNLFADPQFIDPAARNYSIPVTSPAYGCGAFLPDMLRMALDRASLFNVSNTIQSILENDATVGYRILYSEGTHEEFYNNGSHNLDTTPPAIVVDTATLSLIKTKNFTIHYTSDSAAKTKNFTGLREGTNTLTIQEADAVGNQSTVSYTVTVDTIAPVIVVDPATPIAIQTDVIEIHYTSDGVAKSQYLWGLREGVNILTIEETDTAGNRSTVNYDVIMDQVVPVGTFTVNGGARWINRDDADLNINYTDSSSGMKDMRFSFDFRASWTNWEAFSPIKHIEQLPTSNYIVVQVRDQAGNLADRDLFFEVDTEPPIIAIDPATPTLIHEKNLTIHYTSDNIAKTKTFTDLVEGQNTLAITETDLAGNQTTVNWELTMEMLAPVIVISAETPTFINTNTLTIQYTSDGIAKTKTFVNLVEGENTLAISETNGDGKETTVNFRVTMDTIAPTGFLQINHGDAETNDRTVRLDISAQDASPLKDFRFSTDGGSEWTDWAVFDATKVITLPDGEGPKEVFCQVRDQAGNTGTFSATIHYLAPIQFLSDSHTTDSHYLFRYTASGVEHQETWQLYPGENRLLSNTTLEGFGGMPVFADYVVTLDLPEETLPAMPAVPALPQDLVTMTAANGLVLKYSNGELVAIENPNHYILYLPEFDADKILTGGFLFFSNGDKLLYQNGRAVYRLSAQGEKTVYDNDSRVAYVETATHKKIRFNYRLSDTEQVLSIVSVDDEAVSLYDVSGKPVWIKKTNGTAIHYQNGFLDGYIDASGNIFHYELTTLYAGETISGYRSTLVSVTRAGISTAIPLATIQGNLDSYPSIKATLQNDLSSTIEYDPSGNMKRVVSGVNEILELENGLPVSFTNRSGDVFNVQNQLSADQELLSISINSDNVNQIDQIYDGSGHLAAIRLEDGTSFRITGETLERINLEDGSSLTNLVWDGQNLTGFTRTYQDGSREVYQNSQMAERIAADGSRTTFMSYLGLQGPQTFTTEDGRTYRVVLFRNASGTQEQLTQLSRIDLPGGAWIEFDQGKPVRYSRYVQVQMDPLEIPTLPDGKYFVPKVTLQDAELRSLTVDQNGFIYSGEILFNDGMQYLIENNLVTKQIAPSGQFIEFSDTPQTPVEPQASIPPEPLTAAETAYRNDLIGTQLDYFVNGIGIHEGTGLPVDNYIGTTQQQSNYSQATLVGFWAEILAAIASGDYQTSKISRLEAFQKLNSLLTTYQEVQRQVGWNGMVAFFTMIPHQEAILDEEGHPTGEMRIVYTYQRQFTGVGFGDNVNLSVSLASVIGALQGSTLNAEMAAYRDQILNRSNLILTAQEPGYAAFYDSSKGSFRQAWQFQGYFTGYMDRVFDEFRPGLAWLAARYPQYQNGFNSMSITLRNYKTESGEMEIATPYDGNAFQMFWPLIHVDETKYPELEPALRNFLYAQAEFVRKNHVSGLLSAGDNPGQGYEGKIGLPDAAEADDLRFSNIGSIYGTASAFGVAPHYTLQFLKNLETQFPEIRTNAGFIDAIKMQAVTQTDPVTGLPVEVQEPLFSTQYFGVDQASFILSLLRTSQTYFENYLENQNLKTQFDSVYQSIHLNLSPAPSQTLPVPPSFDQTVVPLYNGTATSPDGASAGLVKMPSFIPTLFDSEYGNGRIFEYRTASRDFNHMEIEFGSGNSAIRMGFQEYLMLPGRAAVGRSILESYKYDILAGAQSGDFYTPGAGFCRNMLVYDPQWGEVRHVFFDAKYKNLPVGIWSSYANFNLGQYDFLSVAVRIGEDTPEKIRLKFEFKGTGNIFVTEPLKHGWQFINIPVPKPVDGPMYEIATVIQTLDGSEVSGDFYLGPLSGFKVRTSNTVDWASMLGMNPSSVQQLIVGMIGADPGGRGGLQTIREALENFTIDSTGKLVSGTLRQDDGDIKYFQNGKLVKWIFKNGRTVLFENGLASFVVDLARGKLEMGRFYYDQDLRGDIRSFVIQDNDRKRIFGADGQLQTMIDGGNIVQMQDGKISSIQNAHEAFTNLEFADDGSLLAAHVVLADGTSYDIDQRYEQVTDMGGGVKIYSQTYSFGIFITAIETPQNGKTRLNYHYYSGYRVSGVDAIFWENGQWRTMSLFEFLLRPERATEREYLLPDSFDVLSRASVSGFSVGNLPAGETTQAVKRNGADGSKAEYTFKCLSSASSAPTLGMVADHPAMPVTISKYGFLTITLKQDPSMDWNQDFVLKLKTTSRETLYTFEIDHTNQDYQTFWFPLADKSGEEGQITLELVRQDSGVGKTGTIYVKDLSYATILTAKHPLWEDQLTLKQQDLLHLKNEAQNLISVSAAIATQTPPKYNELAAWLDTPTTLNYIADANQQNQLVSFQRFDGSKVELQGQDVKRITLPDGTVNEYSAQGNTAQGTIRNPSESNAEAGSLNYHYGALRKITQPDGREYFLSYEFDAEGKEITVFRDVRSGEERRFKDGKLLSSSDPNQLQTHYAYENGELIGAELTYRDRVLNSTRYSFHENGTQVTDERGTIWFYNADGELIKHMTRDGYLYEYSEYTQEPVAGGTLDPNDYKSVLYGGTGLRAVSLKGYQTADGSWISWNGTQGSEIHLASGAQGMNLEFDEEQRIQSGQIQFPDGMILEIENFIPVRGRFAGGQTFEYILPQANSYELLQDGDGTYLGFRFKAGEVVFTYNIAGELTRTESENGILHTFTYVRDAEGNPMSYTRLERRQIAFNGVPFPKESELIAGTDQKLMDSGKETAVHQGSGFLVAVYKEATNQWDAYSGTFAVESDRVGLRYFLSEIKTGESVAAVVSDPAFSQATDEILALLEGLGAGQVRSAAAANNNWSFFGNENLSLGQGFEKVGADSFSTVTETTSIQNLTAGQIPVFANVNMFFKMSQAVAGSFSDFLKSCQILKVARDLQAMTVYDAQDEIVYSRRLDGIHSYYEHGKIRETFDKDGTLLSVQEYSCPVSGCRSAGDMTLKQITLVKARQDFEAQAAQMSAQIEQAKFDALYRLAWQDEVARLQIRENVDAGVAQIASQIAGLESQRFRTVKECHRFLFWKTCTERTFEVPGVQSMINQLAGQRAELMITGEGQLAAIPGAVASKKLEIEQATAEKMAELQAQKDAFLLDILHQEMEPIITDFYRRILGRDASKQEFDQWVNRSKAAGRLDIAVLRSELENSAEKTVREGQKTVILQGVRNFLESYVAAAQEVKAQLLQSLQLNASEVVALDAADATEILEWLESRDLHFGQSAFLSLKKMLASQGAEVPIEVIGKETILIDILTGTITRFTEGDLLISMFAMDRTAAIHAEDFAAVRYSYADFLSLYQTVCGLLSVDCGLRVIAHVGEDHFVVVKRVTETQVIYEETGKGAEGEEVTVSKEDFLKVWIAKDNAGHLMVSADQAIQAKKLSDKEAMKIRGAFFFIPFFIYLSIALTVASMIVSTFSPTFGKILGYAALVAGIIGIVGSLGQFIVQGVKMVFSSIAQQGVFATIKQGMVYVGKVLFESVKSVGRFIQNTFAFIKDGFSGGFGSFGAGITQMKTFLFEGAGKIIPNSGGLREFTFAQTAARGLIAAGLNIGVSAGLEGLGLDPRLTQLAAAFVGGAFLGIGQAGTSFIRSGLQSFMMQGVSQMGLHLGLAPPITDALSLLATTSMGSLFNGNLTVKLGEIAPTLASKLTLGGLDLLGRSLGLDPRLTQLLGLPISSIVGNITARFSGTIVGYRDDGTPIYVTNPYDTGSLWDSIKNSLTNSFRQIGFDFIGQITHPLFGSLLSSNVLSSVAQVLGKEGLFDGILDILKTVALAPFNLINGIIQTTIQGLRNFNDLIQEKGLIGAFESLVTSIFSRNTLEKLLNFGGVSGFLGSTAKTLTTLANGQQVQEQKLDGSTSLYYDLLGNFIGKKENGVTQIGTFGINAAGQWALLAGTFFAEFLSGWAFAGEVENGQLKSGKLYQGETLMGEFTPEHNDGTIRIDGSHPDAQQFDSSGNFWNMVFKFIPYAMEFVFSSGLLQSVNFISGSSQNTDPDKPFFVLANGVGNPSATGLPDYINHLTSDLQTSSNNQITYDDILKPPLYNGLLGGGTTDQVKDILHWLAEANTPYVHLDLVAKIQIWMNAWRQVIAARPVVGVGFSGGFEPLVESLVGSSYNVTALVSLAGIIGNLAGISVEVLNLIITVADQIESGTVNGLRGFLDDLFSRIPVVGDIVQLATSIVNFVNNHSIGLAFDTLKTVLMEFMQLLPPALPPAISPSAGVLVNVYGTADILYKLNLIGARDSIADFTPDDRNRRLFNIEIVGATHSGYMRRDDPSLNQPAINAFVTKLIEQSSSEEKLSAFLLGDNRVTFDALRQVWVVNP